MERPKIGVGALVLNEGKILLGKRIHAHGVGTWCPPGGHLEFGETPADCAARELEEETGLIAEEIFPGPWTNDIFETEGKHYVSLFMLVNKFQGVLELKEPDKCESWEWFSWDALPSPLFLSLENLVGSGVYNMSDAFL
ncbi:nucleotide triphosphate diphosphatase NUDT15 [Candidatus Neptunochlamydia vexilliferae]|uniref:nucleotide triphosphate diphosphatase NUDT15 n=1 Tax=Candidatus Neptunichlamydia vexilliferae TaxID=1651774 RepID=UPI001891CFD1|nr:NUDIX hydrolase [Candidatus Neptunochlamydia vexilliferae]